MKKKYLWLFLALVMVLGITVPTMSEAAGPKVAAEASRSVEAEGELAVSENGKLRIPLTVSEKANGAYDDPQNIVMKLFSLPRFSNVFAVQPNRAPAQPGFGETTITVTINKVGIDGDAFAFEDLFGSNETTIKLVEIETDEVKEVKTFTRDQETVTFDTVVSMEAVSNDELGIEFEGENVAGKLVVDESSLDPNTGTNKTTATLNLYQVRNTDVVVKTVDETGSAIANPTTDATSGKIKLNNTGAQIDIPAGNDAVQIGRRANKGNMDAINAGIKITVEGLENGVLVDKAANKVYKPGDITPDPAGLQPTEITFTEKPLVTTDDKSGDTDYVKVDFAAGDHGTLETTPSYYVYKGVTMANALGAPEVTPNAGWTFNTWDPALTTTYDADTTHTATYAYNGENVVPQQPGEDKPDVPANFVAVTFDQGEHGSFVENAVTTYWVNPAVEVTVTEPGIKANDGFKYTGWDKQLTGIFNEETTITAQYKAKVVTEDPGDEAYANVSFETSKGTLNGTAKYWVLKNEEVTITPPTVDGLTNYEFKGWEPAVQTSYAEDTVHRASFNYTGENVVPQQPGEDKPDVPANFVAVTFDQGEHGIFVEDAVTTYWVNPEIEVELEAPGITPEENFKHIGWDQELKQTFTAATTITAQYKAKVVTEDPGDEAYANVSFETSKGTLNGTAKYWVLKNEEITITPPTVDGLTNYEFKGWEPAVQTSYAEDTVHRASFNYTGENVVPQQSGEDKPDVPANFVAVTFDQGEHGSFVENAVTTYWVNPEVEVTVTEPGIKANDGFKYTGWDKQLTGIFNEETTITAQYTKLADTVGPVNPTDTPNPDANNYWTVTFKASENGSVAEENTVYVLKTANKTFGEIDKTAVTADPGYKFDTWDMADDTVIDGDKEVTASFVKLADTVGPVNPTDTPNPDANNYWTVTFKASENGSVAEENTVYVLKTANKTFGEIDKTAVTADPGYKFDTWDMTDDTVIDGDKEVTASFVKLADIVGPVNPTDTPNPDANNYWTVTFKAGENGNVAAENTVYVLKTANKTFGEIDKAAVTADPGYKFDTWDMTDDTVIDGDKEVTASFVEIIKPSRPIENLQQTYDENTETKTITGKISGVDENNPLDPDKTTATLVDGDGNEIKGSDGESIVPGIDQDGNVFFPIDEDALKDREIYVVVQEEGKAPTDPAGPLTLDLTGPEITGNVIRDAYGYQIKVRATASDGGGILKITQDATSDVLYEKTDPVEQNVTTQDKVITVQNSVDGIVLTAVDIYGNKTSTDKIAIEKVLEPIVIKLERPQAGDDFLNVTVNEEATLTIEVDNQVVMTDRSINGFETIQLENMQLEKGQRVKITATKDGRTGVINSRVR